MHFYTLSYTTGNKWTDDGNLHHLGNDLTVILKDDKGTHYLFHILPGFVTDGGSVPKAFQWFVPSWSSNNELINIAYALHDALYASALLPRNIADDILRGMLRDAGLTRVRASTVCFCVNNFARKHYGPKYDKFDVAKFVKLKRWLP